MPSWLRLHRGKAMSPAQMASTCSGYRRPRRLLPLALALLLLAAGVAAWGWPI